MAANLTVARLAAEAFRANHITGKLLDRFPLDTVFLASNVLRLNFIEIPNLEKSIGASAALKPNLTDIYLDEELSAAYDSPVERPWKKDRLRFSVAHEIGHICMHSAIVPKIRYGQIADMKRIFNEGYLEKNDVEIVACFILSERKVR